MLMDSATNSLKTIFEDHFRQLNYAHFYNSAIANYSMVSFLVGIDIGLGTSLSTDMPQKATQFWTIHIYNIIKVPIGI